MWRAATAELPGGNWWAWGFAAVYAVGGVLCAWLSLQPAYPDPDDPTAPPVSFSPVFAVAFFALAATMAVRHRQMDFYPLWNVVRYFSGVIPVALLFVEPAQVWPKLVAGLVVVAVIVGNQSFGKKRQPQRSFADIP